MILCFVCGSCKNERGNKALLYSSLNPNPPVLTAKLKENILKEFNDIDVVRYQAAEPEILMWTRYKPSPFLLESQTIVLIWAKVVDSTNKQYWGLLLLGQECDSLHNCSEWSHLYAAGFVDSMLDSQQVHIRKFGDKRANDSMNKAINNLYAGSRKIFTSPPSSSEIMRFMDMCECYGYPIVEIATPTFHENVDKGAAIQTFFSQETWYKVTGDDINSVLPIYRMNKRIEDYERIRDLYEK
ncbi:MAG: hypothetical protein K1X90_13365 [Candidatus Kapabacteria bacterium]|nr:hypothetical protein [Candidatus Kapabacteria bacterium]